MNVRKAAFEFEKEFKEKCGSCPLLGMKQHQFNYCKLNKKVVTPRTVFKCSGWLIGNVNWR